MVPCASIVETISTVPSLSGAYIHRIQILVFQGLVIVSILDPAHYEVKTLFCKAHSSYFFEVIYWILHLLFFLEDSGNYARSDVLF